MPAKRHGFKSSNDNPVQEKKLVFQMDNCSLYIIIINHTYEYINPVFPGTVFV